MIRTAGVAAPGYNNESRDCLLLCGIGILSMIIGWKPMPLAQQRHKQCSKSGVQKIIRFAFGTSFVVCATLSCFAGETVSYPGENPVFAVEVPNGWEAKHEHGAVRIVAQQAEAVFLLQHIDNIKDEETAKEALPELAGLQAKQFALEEMKVAIPTSATAIGDFKGFFTECTGKDKHGNDTVWRELIFSPKDNDYYLVTCLWTKDDAAKTAADRIDIFKSLRAVRAK